MQYFGNEETIKTRLFTLKNKRFLSFFMAGVCSTLGKQLVHCVLYIIVLFSNLVSYFYQPSEQNMHWKEVNFSDQQSLTNCTNDGPLITFTGGGLLYGFYLGVLYFMVDHFDISKSKVKLSGISCGSTVVMCVFFELTLIQSLELGRIWIKLFAERKPIYFFLQTSQLINEVYDILINDYGMDNELTIRQRYEKYGENCIYFGVTAIDYNCDSGKYELKPLMIHSFQTIKQFLYALSITTRILPFFKTLGYWNNRYCMDGLLSHKWADIESNLYGNERNIVVGENINEMKSCTESTLNEKSQVIRVSIRNCKEADICSDYAFASWQYFRPFFTIEEDFQRFVHGYRSAAKLSVILNLIRKGMILKEMEMQEIFQCPNVLNFDLELNWDEIKWQNYVNKKLEQYEDQVMSHFHER